MDLHEEAVRSLRGYSPHRSCEAREVGLISISEDPRLVRAMPIPATECSSKAAANAPETRRKFTKDVKSNGTNRRSPLESTKVPKKQTQKASKRGRKMCREYAKKLKQSERATPKGQILAAGLKPCPSDFGARHCSQGAFSPTRSTRIRGSFPLDISLRAVATISSTFRTFCGTFGSSKRNT